MVEVIVVDIVAWIQSNWTDVVKVIAYVIAGASVVVKLTPTPKDDIILGKVKTFLSKFIALNP